MQNIGTTLAPNVPLPFQIRGTVLQILSSGQSAGLTVQFMQGGQVQYTVEDVQSGWKLKPAGGFDGITIMSATGDTISAIVTAGDVDIQILETFTQISNTTANPVPVSIDGGTVELTASNVGINNTTSNPVPVEIVSEPGAPFSVQNLPAGTAVSDAGTAAVTTSGAQVIAASAGRKRVIFRNSGTGQLGITAAGPTTFANAAIVLQPGDAWKETDAPQLAWYAVSDVGTNVTIQTVN
jgi:hypothetical protein